MINSKGLANSLRLNIAGYKKVRVRGDDVPKMEFRTRYANYKLLVTSFGLNNAPTAFMDLMNMVFQSYLDPFVIVLIEKYLGTFEK